MPKLDLRSDLCKVVAVGIVPFSGDETITGSFCGVDNGPGLKTCRRGRCQSE